MTELENFVLGALLNCLVETGGDTKADMRGKMGAEIP